MYALRPRAILLPCLQLCVHIFHRWIELKTSKQTKKDFEKNMGLLFPLLLYLCFFCCLCFGEEL